MVGSRQWSITAMPARRLICRNGTACKRSGHAVYGTRRAWQVHCSEACQRMCCLACARAAVGVLLVSLVPLIGSTCATPAAGGLLLRHPISRPRNQIALLQLLLLLLLLSMPMQLSKRPGHRWCRCVWEGCAYLGVAGITPTQDGGSSPVNSLQRSLAKWLQFFCRTGASAHHSTALFTFHHGVCTSGSDVQ